MSPAVDPPPGRLVAHLVSFARTLRAAGLAIGPDRLLTGIAAIQAIGLERREDVYWALHAAFLSRHDQREIFDQAFHLFWRNPRILERAVGLILPKLTIDTGETAPPPLARRLAEAMTAAPASPTPDAPERVELDGALTFSARETLHQRDFDKMSLEELAAARAAMRQIAVAFKPVPTRRWRPTATGPEIDRRASLRGGLRGGADAIRLHYRTRRERPPPLVVLCDISGSMSRYARLFLQFLHAVTNERTRVHSFAFGTRLTNITPALARRDVDQALDRVAASVVDWSGGTRIGECIARFNRDWSRRVLGQGAIVLLVSDGLDRAGGEGLTAAMERLNKSCRRLIWLNPLLRWDGFEPKSIGARAMLPHVDEFRPVHNLDSLTALGAALARPARRRLGAAEAWAASPGRPSR